jgi:hypothetical protein
LCCVLAVALVASGAPVYAGYRSTDKVKSELSKIGTGEKARVTVKLKSGALLKGFISVLDEDDFTIISETGTQRVLYSEVKKVKKAGLNAGIKIAIVAGALAATLLGVMYAACGSGGCH